MQNQPDYGAMMPTIQQKFCTTPEGEEQWQIVVRTCTATLAQLATLYPHHPKLAQLANTLPSIEGNPNRLSTAFSNILKLRPELQAGLDNTINFSLAVYETEQNRVSSIPAHPS